MQFREIIIAYSEKHVEPLNTSAGKVNDLTVKADKTVIFICIGEILSFRRTTISLHYRTYDGPMVHLKIIWENFIGFVR
jgi:hypothetical protein